MGALFPIVTNASYAPITPKPYSGTNYGGGSSSPRGGDTSRTVAQAFSPSCAPSTTSARAGESVVWFASITGGSSSGSYTYLWNGTDGLTGNTSSVQRAYSVSGSKFATLTVLSGGQSVTVNCTDSVTVYLISSSPPPASTGFGISCYAPEERILPGESGTWLSIANGLSATAPTTYQWDGTDGLTGTGPAAFKTYTTNGRKFAILTVTSGNLRASVACTNQITVAPRTIAAVRPAPPPPLPPATTTLTSVSLQGICSTSVQETTVGKEVLWQLAVVGGTGVYAFSWQGDEGLSGTGTTTKKTYETEGTKRAAATTTSGDKTIVIPCAPVEILPFEGSGLLAGGLSLLGHPIVLILSGVLALLIGIYFAIRRRRQEESANEEKEAAIPQRPH